MKASAAETTDLAGTDPVSLFNDAYREYSSAVRGYLRARGVEDPEAVTQDVFVALYSQLGAARGGVSGLRALIFSIAHARAVDSHRRRARRPAAVEYDPAQDFRHVESAEDRVLDAMTDGQALLEDLPDDYREVLALRIIAELSLEATARIMGKSTGAIKQLQRRAVARLKQNQLEKKGRVGS